MDSQHPATLLTVDPNVGYYPNGTIRKVTLGNGLTETAANNNRLQPCRMNVNSTGGYYSQCTDAAPSGNVLDFTYGFNAGTNNGNINSWSAAGNQTFSRTYTYDSLNRIATMVDSASSQSCKGLSWTIDRWGNRTDQTVTNGTCNTFHQAVDTTSNRLLGAPFQYDAAGNMIHDASHSYTYDAENRLIQVDGGSTATYAYDPDGRRVAKTISGTTTNYAYDGSDVLFETQGSSWATAYIYFAGALHAQYKNNTTYFLHRDHLGSTRLVTGLGGTTVDNLDYLPFGEQISGGTSTTHKFTGKERDAETGLDYFMARHMAPGLGRFLQPDPAGNLVADPGSPQSWHLYSYVWNNPLANIDPSGTTCVTLDDGSVGDDGDGQGCAEAGVPPGNPDNPGTFGPPQTVDVNAQQGSLWDYLWATTFNQIPIYVPDDVPLSPTGQAFARELSKRINNYPTVCGGGWYTYAGKELHAGPVSAFAGAITEHDSRTGNSKGALFEGGYGEGIVGGVGYVGTTSGGKAESTGLAYVGLGGKSNVLSGSAGVVGFGSVTTIGGAGVYAEGFRGSRGGGFGAYVNISSIGGCH
jgi:RHS repeat-associated protein